jgi:glucosamine-6-phosphate deaminase
MRVRSGSDPHLLIREFHTAEAAARALAREVGSAIEANPRLVLGLPTGRTPVPFYRELTACCGRRRIDFSRVTTFNLDEFVGLHAADPRSFRAYMQRHLFDHVTISPRRIHFLNGAAPDPLAECRRYERVIARAGGLDLVILGLGVNGHIGFNEPGDTLIARTHRTKLAASTRRANEAGFVIPPREALTMGMATILRSRRIVVLATGRGKARVVSRMVNGPITTRLPASFLQLHRSVEVWVDRGAQSELRT